MMSVMEGNKWRHFLYGPILDQIPRNKDQHSHKDGQIKIYAFNDITF